MRRELLLAHIIVIPKEGKDTSICYNYRPIALLNMDTKLYAKVLTTRIKEAGAGMDPCRSNRVYTGQRRKR